MKKQLYTKKEVAETLSVSVEVVRELVREHQLEEVEVRQGITRIRRSSVLKYLNQKKGFPLSRIFTFLWITAIAAFGIQLYIFATFFNEKVTVPNWLLILMFINISLGILFFLGIVVSGRRKTNLLPKHQIWSIYLIYLLLAVTPVLAGSKISPNKSSLPTVLPTPTITSTPAPIQKVQVKQNTQTKTNTNTATGSQVECIGPDGKHFNTSMDECTKLNEKWGKPVDYMTECNIHPDCGGGTVRMSYSQCKKPCSGKTPSNTAPPVVYVSSAPSANKTAVFLSYGGYTIYCPSQNVGAVIAINSTMESKKTEWAKNYNTCAENFYNTDPCYVACKQTHKSDWDVCTATYGYSGSERDACTKTATDKYGTCITACPTTSSKCDYVYAEQKSLTNQINNLCK